jgi:hypothetical protein
VRSGAAQVAAAAGDDDDHGDGRAPATTAAMMSSLVLRCGGAKVQIAQSTNPRKAGDAIAKFRL